MQNNEKVYDCTIVGGGLAGLCLAIQLSQLNHSVIVFEKNEYPFHKVCGEYISSESWNFLLGLGLNLPGMKLPQINQLGVSSIKGFMLEAPLKMGGFGISRFKLDHELALIARQNGATVLENCKVNGVKETAMGYSIDTTKGVFFSKIACGSYGKHSPVFIDKPVKKNIPNYIGVKYHVKTDFDASRIELHNFKDGYCGISKVEDEVCCLCYITTAENLNKNNNDIKQLEQDILFQNPFLKHYFSNSEFLFNKPLTISQITFEKKKAYSNGLFLLGDSAGAIAPLCGNGMSMGMRASKLLALLLHCYFKNEITKENAIELYGERWDQNFSTRIKTGYYLQQILGKNTITHLSLKLLNSSPNLLQKIIRLTHGEKF